MLQVEGIKCELNYLFIAIFESGLTIEQDKEDRSKVWTQEEPRSAWHDVMVALEKGDKLLALALAHKDGGRCLTVNFPELSFEIEGLVFRAHEGQPVFNARPIYCRRRTAEIGMGGVIKAHAMRFRLGWQGNLGPEPGAPNIERIMEIEND